MPTMPLSHKLKLFSHFVTEKRYREIYNMLWVYPLWWNRRTATFLLNNFFPKLGIDLFPPFLEIEPTTICNFRCVCCVPENATILSTEPKHIQEINIEDSVYGTKGIRQKVNETFSREYKGNLIEVKAEGILPFSVTPEHRILVSKRTWQGRPKKDRKYIYLDKLEFIEAEKLNRDYALIFPKLKESREIKEVEGIKVTKDLMKFLGIYLAEGYTVTSKRTTKGKIIGNHGTIRFVFGKHEKELIDKTFELINRVFNKKPNTIQTRTSTDLSFFSVKIAKWLSEFGKRAHQKRIPEFIMSLKDRELIRSFIDSFIEGDGYINSKYVQLTTSSRVLALQLQKLLSRLDIFAGLYQNKRAGESIIEGRTVKINNLYNLRIRTPDFYEFLNVKNQSKRRINLYKKNEDYFLLPIKSTSRSKYNGKVYNLETDDKTFELNNIVIHNCEHSYWKEHSKNMTFEEFKKIFDQFGKPKWLGLTGIGSSYLNKDFHKMVAYAKSKGTIVELMDHFAHFKDNNQIKELIEIGPDFQFVSTYGATKNSFEKVCFGSNYDKIEHNIKTFVKLKKQLNKKFPILNFHYIITKDSKDEILQFLDFVYSLNTEVGEILVTPMIHKFKEAEKFAVSIDEEYVKKIKERAEKYKIPITVNMCATQDIKGTKPPITQCKEYIMPFIFVTGHVTPCCGQNEENKRDWQKATSPGNLLNQNIKDVWYSPKYKRMRQMIRQNKCPPECANCPAYKKSGLRGC